MNICLTVPRLNIGGAETYCRDLACALVRRGHRVCVVSGGGHWVRDLRAHGVRHYRWPIRLNYRLASWFIARVARREKIDLLHANSNAAIFATAMASEQCGIPFVATCHGMFNQKELDRGIRSAARLICVSEVMRSRELNDTDVEPERLLVIYNGIDCTRFDPVRFPKVPHPGFQVGIVSRLRSLVFKGHYDIMRGMSEEPPTPDPWRLCVVGKGRSAGKLRALAHRLGIAGRVEFCGQSTDMPQTLARLDALVLATRYETFGLVLAEAMAMELPVVSYDSGGPAEVIVDGECGRLIPCGDYRALVAAIAELRADPERAAEMGRAGRKRVLERFSLEGMIDRVEACYEEVLGGKKS